MSNDKLEFGSPLPPSAFPGRIQSSSADPRVRLENAEYRVTAPNGKQKDGRFFVNGHLIVEKKDKASLGEPTFVKVAIIVKPPIGHAGDASMEEENQRNLAIWSLLANGGE